MLIQKTIIKKAIKRISWQLFLTAALVILPALNVNAAPSGAELFSVNSSPVQKQYSAKSASGTMSAIPIATWFEKYDELRDKYHPTDGDKVILTRPLMQEAERVQQWTDTANKISKNYSLLSKAIRNMPLPASASDVKEYRDLMADWYQDAASVYAELIRPRPPARTIEDLQEQLDAIKKRSESLGDNIANLKAMDQSLRQHYQVHPALQDDAIQQFVRSK